MMMMNTVLVLQAMLLCSTSVCWGQNCSSTGQCGIINLNETGLDEAVAAIMSQVRLLLPEADNSTNSTCQSKCWDGTAGGDNSTRNATARVEEILENIRNLTKQLEESMNQTNLEAQLTEAVKSFMEDRDWPKLLEVLEAVLEPDDPALLQARDVDRPDGESALGEIVSSNKTRLLQLLLDHDLDVGVRWNARNMTMLHDAAMSGNVDVAEVLFSRGALVDARASLGLTPLLLAATSLQPDMVLWLLEHGANPHAVDWKGWTPMHWAARQGDLASVRILEKAGAEKDARNYNGLTPCDEALHAKQMHVVDYLGCAPFSHDVQPE